ncbi:divalent-cation tolerance protein CutA [Campylobacter sp. MIT 12-5580]|uniref:divalent-cation tolerance protein CutA n=1 Tax=Campylobacter sp. MIT 12-5580 TaxID=2040651 RepID=UPI0010F4B3A7|nr:divalent-cation tolerance protein CutA [Campylobacter sp. MIT 12-5580]TKX28098.1 divalent-cation tolerance protein CutA [Campylobacter sp. MIT 12-5580]
MIVLSTTASKKEAKALGKLLLEKRLVTCVQRLKIKSMYRWENTLCKAKEYLLILKTTKENLNELESIVKANHSYEVPQFVALKADFISKEYKKWLEKECKSVKNSKKNKA